jgi:hypothetical protein
MADIIEFGKKAMHLKSERETTARRRKIEALRKIFQCTRCVVKCARCGAQIDSRSEECSRYAAPYGFCRHCRQEYEEYRARVDGIPATSDSYWQNSTWMQVWETWLQHQKALDRYRQSKEFMQLLDEVEHLLREQ